MEPTDPSGQQSASPPGFEQPGSPAASSAGASPTPGAKDIFLSYSHRDEAAIRELLSSLQQAGFIV